MFSGQVADFLAENNLIITKTMQSQFQQLFTRLSPVEKAIILQLSNLEKPVPRKQLKDTIELSSMDYINGLQSLQQRYLITITKQPEDIEFNLSPIFREYIKTSRLLFHPILQFTSQMDLL